MFKFNWNIEEKNMSGLENLKQRLNYRGGNAEGRFQEDKLKTLKKSFIIFLSGCNRDSK